MNNNPPFDLNVIQSILDVLPMGIYIIDKKRRLKWVNERVAHRNKMDGDGGSIGKRCYTEIFKRKRPCNDCPAVKTFRTGKTERVEKKNEYKGEMRSYLVTTTPLQGVGPGKEMLVIETVQDITYQKKAEEELRRLNDFNAAIIENAPVAIFTIDKNGEFTSVNPALAELSGLGAEAEEKLLGFNWLKNPYTVRCGLAEFIKKGLKGKPFELQDFPFTTYRGDKGQYLHFRGVPLKGKDRKVEGLLCIIEDTTEKVRAQIKSIQDAKTAVIGRLMTGVAHELNNPLATIAANSELACELVESISSKEGADKGDIEELYSYLNVIQEQAFRCKNIIRDMIDITKKKGFEIQEIDLNGCLEEVLNEIKFEKMDITLSKEIEEDLPPIMGDLNAMKQSLRNIIQNGVDAVADREGGAIKVRAFTDGRDVKIEIEDNGVGIHDGLIDRIFEPFFSTKEKGKGVGLGLTLSHEFISRMGGSIEVKSKLGIGSIFTIILPSSDKGGRGLNDKDSYR
ncbi:MAG: ATP-binding protein [Syntrophorhabdaceae bacterium]|nr:ATP-binding protein [Syntrophorhabdaceae bacterium]